MSDDTVKPDPAWLEIQRMLRRGENEEALQRMAEVKANGGVPPTADGA